MPYKCSSCGLEYDLEEEAKECCGADADIVIEEDFGAGDAEEYEEDDKEE